MWWNHLGNPHLNKEKQIWVIREKKTKARGNNSKRPSLVQRKSENRKKKKEKKNKCSVTLLVCQFFTPFEKRTATTALRDSAWYGSTASMWGARGEEIERYCPQRNSS